MKTLTSTKRHNVLAGDRLRMSDQPRNVIAIVDVIESGTEFTFKTYRRPSRGYARHVRRGKANSATPRQATYSLTILGDNS